MSTTTTGGMFDLIEAPLNEIKEPLQDFQQQVEDAFGGSGGFVRLSAFASLADLLTAIGATPTLVVVDAAATISSNTTIPSTATLWFIEPGQFSVNTSIVLTINGAIISGPRQIFAGAGTIGLASNQLTQEYQLKWWGAVGDWNGTSGADDTTAINKALAALPHGRTLRLNTGNYRHTGLTLSEKFQVTLIGSDSFTGSGDLGRATFYYTGTNGGISITLSNVYGCTFASFVSVAAAWGDTVSTGAKTNVLVTQTGSGSPHLTSHCTFQGITTHAKNTRSDYRGISFFNDSLANNEQHTVRECRFFGGDAAFADLQGWGLHLGHGNVKAIVVERCTFHLLAVGVAAVGSFRAYNNIFSEVHNPWWLAYGVDAISIHGDDIESIKQYLLISELHGPVYVASCRVNDLRGDLGAGTSAANAIIKHGSHIWDVTLDGCVFTFSSGASPASPYLVSGEARSTTFRNCALARSNGVPYRVDELTAGFSGYKVTWEFGGASYRVGKGENDRGETMFAANEAPAPRALWSLPDHDLVVAGIFPSRSLFLGGTAIAVTGLHTPPNPTVEVIGTPGSTSRRFRLIARDANANRVRAEHEQSVFTFLENSPSTLDGTNYLRFTWPSQSPGATDYLLLEIDPGNPNGSGRIAATITPGGGSVQTYNLQTTPSGAYDYVLPTKNETSGVGVEGPLLIGKGTTTQRNALTGVADSMLFYNTTTGTFQGRAAGAWVDLSSASAVGTRVFHSAAQSINNNTETKLAFDSERYDTDSIHDPSTNNSRLTCPASGRYAIFGTVRFASNATGHRYIFIRLNGGKALAVQSSLALSGIVTMLSISTIYDLTASDYVELWVYQNSGGALDVTRVDAESPEFGIERL